MSMRTTTLAWNARVQPWVKLVLLALAEVSADTGEHCDFMGAATTHVMTMTGLTEETIEGLLLDLWQGDSLPSDLSGHGFMFEAVVERAEARYAA